MRITKKYLLAFSILSFFSLFQVLIFNPASVLAQTSAGGSLVGSQVGLNDIGHAYGNSDAVPTDIRYTIARIINIVLGFLGVIFLALTIFAGFQYMTAAGNEEQAKKAITLLKNAVIGLVIILVSWGVTRYILTTLSGAVNNTADYQTYHSYP